MKIMKSAVSVTNKGFQFRIAVLCGVNLLGLAVALLVFKGMEIWPLYWPVVVVFMKIIEFQVLVWCRKCLLSSKAEEGMPTVAGKAKGSVREL